MTDSKSIIVTTAAEDVARVEMSEHVGRMLAEGKPLSHVRDRLYVCRFCQTYWYDEAECTALLRHALERERAGREDAERKGRELCQLAGTMMLACKRLAVLQESHRNMGDPLNCAPRALCGACRIPLPDLSDEAIKRLVEGSASAASLRAERDRLLTALLTYGRHHYSCASRGGGGCDCGLESARGALGGREEA